MATPPAFPSRALRGLALVAILALIWSPLGAQAPAPFSMAEGVAEIPIHWVDLPRPSPQPPLDHGALLVPVAFEGLSGKPLYLQFDLGHPTTVLYAAKWRDIHARLAEAGRAPRTTPTAVENLELRVGGLTTTALKVALVDQGNTGIRWQEDSVEVIGTVGSDLIAGRTVVMDFKADRILVATQRALVAKPGEVFTPFRYRMRRILIPALVDGKPKRIIYDTGSSAFALITDQKSWKRMGRPGATPTEFPVKSWKRTLTARLMESESKVQIGGVTLAVPHVTYIEGTSWLQDWSMRFFGIGGMAGNRLFLGHRLILDTAKQELAISE